MTNPFLRDIDKKQISELWWYWKHLLMLKGSRKKEMTVREYSYLSEAFRVVTQKIQNRN